MDLVLGVTAVTAENQNATDWALHVLHDFLVCKGLCFALGFLTGKSTTM